MDSSKVLATVCVLTVMVGHVNGQFCIRQLACFTNLDIYGFLGIVNVDKICRQTDEVTRCYSELMDCPEITNITSVLPGKSSVQIALDTFCHIKDQILPCVLKSPAILQKVWGCVTHLKSILFPEDRQLGGQFSGSTLAQFLPCLFDALKVCENKEITNSFESIEKLFQQAPSSTPSPKHSGCVKLESWSFLGIIATLISSGVKGF